MAGAVALTGGEPAGVGLELAAAAWQVLRDEQPFYLVADRNHVHAASGPVPVQEIGHPAEALDAMTFGLPLLHLRFPERAVPGKPSVPNATAVIESIRMAANHVWQGDAVAMCTNPINKKIVRSTGEFRFPGQTEFLADLFDVDLAVMMMASPELRVVPATTHIPLADIPGKLTRELLRRTINITREALIVLFGIPGPRIAVAGLNPHAGESGLMGKEEDDVIRPVIGELAALGISVEGPFSADTMFHAEARAGFDAAICMFHDQALIPFKTLSFHDGVNVSLGLPIVRTSPDHGPALDIAGKDVAKPDSLVAAIRLAGQLAVGGQAAG